MKMEDVHAASKRFRIFDDSDNSGAGIATAAVVAKVEKKEQQLKEGEENGDVKYCAGRGVIADAAALGAMREQWHPHSSAASRICRVTRASGGKDRHSKVLTAKGLRDRRVRLSVPTAIQFYDLQDRLGYDQPSKAVEWLIKAAAAAIADLPSLDATFPGEEIPIQVAVAGEQDEDAGAEVAEVEQADHQKPQDQPHGSLTKSTCSSTSETSKGSVLSLSRSEIRVKARERARERAATAKEKERDRDGGDEGSQFGSVEHHPCLNLHSSPQNSFIELLTCGGQQNQNHNQGPCTSLNPKQQRHSPASPAVVKTDFFGQMSLLGEGEKSHQPPGFPSQAHFNIPTAAASTTRDHPELQQQQFSFMPEHLIPLAVTSAGGDYINFSITSGIAGFNRGTLQSNFSPPQSSHHHLQRLSSQVDGSNLPFFLGAATQATPASWDGHFPGGYDSRLHLCYDGYRNSDLKDKGKS